MDIKQVREEIDYAGDHPLEFPLVHTAEWLLVQLEASQQQLAELGKWNKVWKNDAKIARRRRLEMEAIVGDYRKELTDLRAKLAEARLENTKLGSKLETAKTHRKISEAEVKRLEDLYNTDRQAYLDDITLYQTEVGRLRADKRRETYG